MIVYKRIPSKGKYIKPELIYCLYDLDLNFISYEDMFEFCVDLGLDYTRFRVYNINMEVVYES